VDPILIWIRTRKRVHQATEAARVLVGSRTYSSVAVPRSPARSAVHKESAERVEAAVEHGCPSQVRERRA
jgi:hypothetical protein